MLLMLAAKVTFSRDTEAVRAVRAVSGADEMDSETLLKQALKKIMIF